MGQSERGLCNIGGATDLFPKCWFVFKSGTEVFRWNRGVLNRPRAACSTKSYSKIVLWNSGTEVFVILRTSCGALARTLVPNILVPGLRRTRRRKVEQRCFVGTGVFGTGRGRPVPPNPIVKQYSGTVEQRSV